MADIQRRLSAIVCADVAGYSRLMGIDEAGTLAALKGHRQAIDPLITAHGGRIVKTTGDGLLLEFSSVVDAVRSAMAVQAEMAGRNAGTGNDRRMLLRIGIHLGDVIVEDEDIFGAGVNIAARLQEVAEPGGICLSQSVHDNVRGRIDAKFEEGGAKSLKNIAEPVRVYRIQTGERTPAKPSLPLPEKPSLAVLPFQNLSSDPEQEYFADGIVEEITTAIARLPWLFVIARNSSFTYKGTAVDVKDAAAALGVRYVLEGSVRRAGNRVRIAGQLIDTASGAHIWADRFEGALHDIFELQDQVASSVVGAIEPKLRLAEIERAIRKSTEDLSAYDFYLRAVAQYRLRTPEGHRQALDFLRRALELDPNYAPALALGARCRLGQRVEGWPLSEQEIGEAVQFARRAIETAKNEPEALASAAYALSSFTGEHTLAAAAIDRALVLNANSAEAWTAKGWVACYRADSTTAVEAFDRAIRLSPLDPGAYHLKAGRALACLIAGQYAEAAEWADRSLSEQPRYGPALRINIVAHAQLDHIATAQTLLARMNQLQPGLTTTMLRTYLHKNFPSELLATYIDGVRKAGLPET